VVWQWIGALVRASSWTQRAAALVVLLCALMLVIDWTVGEWRDAQGGRPAASTRSVERPTDSGPATAPAAHNGDAVPAERPHRNPIAALLGGDAFVRFIGFSMLSMGLAIGVLFVFWRQTHRSRT